jgi:hypothetical protein
MFGGTDSSPSPSVPDSSPSPSVPDSSPSPSVPNPCSSFDSSFRNVSFSALTSSSPPISQFSPLTPLFLLLSKLLPLAFNGSRSMFSTFNRLEYCNSFTCSYAILNKKLPKFNPGIMRLIGVFPFPPLEAGIRREKLGILQCRDVGQF